MTKSLYKKRAGKIYEEPSAWEKFAFITGYKLSDDRSIVWLMP